MPGSDKRPNTRAGKVRLPQLTGTTQPLSVAPYRAPGYCSARGLESSMTAGKFAASRGLAEMRKPFGGDGVWETREEALRVCPLGASPKPFLHFLLGVLPWGLGLGSHPRRSLIT